MARWSVPLSLGVLAAILVAPPAAHAEPPATLVGTLPQIGRVPVLDGRVRYFTGAASFGYGFVESLEETGTAQHRAQFRAGIGTVPLPWLAASLDFEGAYAVTGDDDSFVLDPRLRLRGALPFDGPLRAGIEAALWIPASTPEGSVLVFDAATVDLIALVSFQSGAWTLAGHAGYRFDGSGQAVTDRSQLAAADIVALRASDHGSVLVGIGGTVRLDPVVLGLEATWEPAVGEDAPSDAAAWPLRLTPMARFAVSTAPSIDVFVLVDALLTGRTTPNSIHLSPFDSRVRVEVGLYVALEPPAAPVVEEERRPTPEPEPDTPAEPEPEPEPEPETPEVEPPVEPPVAPVPLGRVQGRVQGRGSRSAVATVRIEERVAAGVEPPAPREVPVAADGTFGIDLPPGEYQVVVEAPGFRPQRQSVTLGDGATTDLNIDLWPRR